MKLEKIPPVPALVLNKMSPVFDPQASSSINPTAFVIGEMHCTMVRVVHAIVK